MPCARTDSTPSSSRTRRSAPRSSAADGAPAGAVRAQQVAQVLGAHHRPPRPVQRPGIAARVDRDVDRARPAAGGSARHRRRQRPDRVDRGQWRHGVPVLAARFTGGVGVGAVRHREHVAAAVVDDLERTVRCGRSVHRVPDRAGHRIPGERGLAAAGGGGQPGGCGQTGRADGVARAVLRAARAHEPRPLALRSLGRLVQSRVTHRCRWPFLVSSTDRRVQRTPRRRSRGAATVRRRRG